MNLLRLLPHDLGRRAARWLRPRALLLAALWLIAAATGGAVQAQGPEQGARAGIVIDFGDGAIHTACVDLGADGQATGEEVLAAAGFDVLIEYSPMGGAVCKIGGQGCNFPGQPCWCQCMSSPCVYWAYSYLQDGQWLYSTTGASVRTVRAGAVEGWAWGAGSLTQGATPPLVTFSQICAPAAPTDTPTVTPTWTPWPTNTPPPTPTWTPWPTPTSQPTATWTPIPSPTPLSALPAVAWTPTWTPTATSTGTPTSMPTETPTPTWIPTEQAPLTPLASGTAAGQVQPPIAPTAVLPATATEPTGRTGREDVAPPQAVAQVAPSDPPTPTSTPQALAAVVPNPSAGNAPARPMDPVLLTTSRPDYAPLALLIVALTAAFSLGRAMRRGNLLARVRSGGFSRSLTPETAEAVTTSRTAGSGGFSRSVARLLSWAIYGLTAGIGLLALFYPFVTAAIHPQAGSAGAVNTPLLMTVLVALCFLALLFEVQGQAVSAKIIALLGVLVAINSVLRFVEVSIPGPGGFTPIFFLIVLTGYVFGARFGFLMGALTLLVSALITGGIGPWLPGQMFTAGWMGLLAPLAWLLLRLVGGRPGGRAELALLAVFAGLGGLFFGIVINLWFWPYITGPADQYWQAGVGLAETVRRYAVYYLATSLLWDVFAVAGNVLLVMVFGAATLRALRRFQQRFDFEYQPGEPAVREVKTVPERPALAPQAIGRMQRRGGESM